MNKENNKQKPTFYQFFLVPSKRGRPYCHKPAANPHCVTAIKKILMEKRISTLCDPGIETYDLFLSSCTCDHQTNEVTLHRLD